MVKAVKQKNYLAVHKQCKSFEEARQLLMEIITVVPQELGPIVAGNYMGVNHSEGYDMENLDVQMGIHLKESLPKDSILKLPSGIELQTDCTSCD